MNYTYEIQPGGMAAAGPGFQNSSDPNFNGEATLTHAADTGRITGLFRSTGVSTPELYTGGAWVPAVAPMPGVPI